MVVVVVVVVVGSQFLCPWCIFVKTFVCVSPWLVGFCLSLVEYTQWYTRCTFGMNIINVGECDSNSLKTKLFLRVRVRKWIKLEMYTAYTSIKFGVSLVPPGGVMKNHLRAHWGEKSL